MGGGGGRWEVGGGRWEAFQSAPQPSKLYVHVCCVILKADFFKHIAVP